MTKMIEIAALPNGAHRNQTYHGELPEGWALLPADELENFPFGEVEVAEVDGMITVVKWIAGVAPEATPEPEVKPAATVWDELDAAYQEGVNSAYDL